MHVTLAERPAPTRPGPRPGSGWQPAADLPGPVIDGLADSYQGKLYAGLGGQRRRPRRATLIRYDPETGAWTTLASARTPARTRRTASSAASSTSSADSAPRGRRTPTWRSTTRPATPGRRGASMPTPLATAASTVLDGKLYVIGGCSSDYSCGENSTVSVYDPSTDTWSSAPTTPCRSRPGVLRRDRGPDLLRRRHREPRGTGRDIRPVVRLRPTTRRRPLVEAARPAAGGCGARPTPRPTACS